MRNNIARQLMLAQEPTLGERLRLAREAKGLSIYTAAQELNYAMAAIREYEADKKEPRLSTLLRLVALYECDPCWLAFGE